MLKPKIVEVLPGCGGKPIWVFCFSGSSLPGAVRVVVSHDKPTGVEASYILQVPCREADMERVSELCGFHGRSDRQARGETLDENRDAFCINGERCPFGDLTVQEFLFPLLIDELNTDKPAGNSHWDD